ncbi:MAG: ABC transporter ATP-binding protein [Rhodobacteraceae bacterium]|nr:ABC transporter ATP-binding protein [Paracoccaceae bacterium]
MSHLRVDNLRRSFGRVIALDGITFEVADGEFFCLLGPSSSGKTTTLRAIAGLEKLEHGRVHFAGKDVTEHPVQGRGFSMIFQTFALYPHLSVEANLAHPLRRTGSSGEECSRRVGEVAELLRVTHTLKRKPSTLSGGEQQRVAIGRAIVGRPKLLMLDEPLTNLDAKLRDEMRTEFKRLHRELGMTMLYATPDQLEALTMGDRVGVIKDGKIVTTGTSRDLYRAPKDLYVARMVGSPPINFFDATAPKDGQISLPFAEHVVKVPHVSGGQSVVVGLRPHDIDLAEDATAGIPAQIHLTEPLGDVTILDIRSRQTDMKMVLPEEIAARYGVGDQIKISFNPENLHVFDSSTGLRTVMG